MTQRPGRGPVRGALAVAMTVALALGAASCSSDGGSDPDATGPTKQAVEQLRSYGLSAKEAACVVDDIGAQTVLGAADLNALAESQQYQDAAKACVDDD